MSDSIGTCPVRADAVDPRVPVLRRTYSAEEQKMSVYRTLAAVLVTLVATQSKGQSPEDSVVRVFASLRLPNPPRPWAKQSPVEVMGTGVVIDGKTILTNAHIVFYASEVFVQAPRGGDRISAKVASIGPGIDLATLTLEDGSFFEKRPPLRRATKRPVANDAVVLMGFPAGGTGLAVTRGVVSRIDYAPYNDLTDGMRIQVDAVAGPGNSGGPALVDGKMVGLVFRHAQNAGIVIPNEEIDAFLEDVRDGRYDGKPRVVDHFQPLVNEALRKKLGIGRADRGMLVRKTWKCDAAYPLREGDVVTRIGTADVDNEGFVDFEDNMRLPFPALVARLAKNGTVPVRLIRDGKPLDVSMFATREDDRLIKPYQGQYPPYFVHGPLVFSPAIDQAVSGYAEGNPFAMAGSPLVTRESDRVAFPGEELVVVTAPMLAHPITRGYSDPFGHVVKDVDGVPVKNLRHLVEVLRDGKSEYLTIRFHGELSETLVFPRRAIEEATRDLMAENGIPRRGSDDVMVVWNPKTAPGR
jgi:S1-C subfamily serine protease